MTDAATAPATDALADAAAALAQAAADQRAAADPTASVWTTANAGSGKTRVLIDRAARLMLSGVRPERILCLTYTRAAAAEMVGRLNDRLGAWALAEDDALAAQIAEALGERPDRATLRSARRLFATALDTPGGLRVQTIHAWCERALRRFPLEAGVAPDFTVLDERARDALAAEAREATARDAPEAFDAAAAHVGDETLEALCREVLAARNGFGGRDPAAVAAAFALTPEQLDWEPRAAAVDALDAAALRDMAAALEIGGAKDRERAAALRRAADEDAPPAARFDALRGVMLRLNGAPKQLQNVATKAVRTAHPWVEAEVAALQEVLEAAVADGTAIDAARRTADLNRFADAFLAAFEAAKRARGALDFDDLIACAGRLLADPEAGDWARYKLDGGARHILLDEAQDTAPAQWAVVQALAAEALAGAGAGEAGQEARTLFVVGDEKQSIYSFQGADLDEYAAARARFAAALGPRLRAAPLRTSFRSAAPILAAVDATFAGAQGVSDGPVRHHAAFPDRPGLVEVWPLVPPDAAPPDPVWGEALDAPAAHAARVKLARALADVIVGWLRGGETLPGGGRAMRPGDVLVLVRRRDALAAELIRRLKVAGVATAGADRLKLSATLAAKDLLALMRFAVTPEDDLALAALLRSPICGVPLSAIEALALAQPPREAGGPRRGWLWPALRAAPELAAVAALLGAARDRADFLRPFEFLTEVLEGGGARARLVGRLGPDAADAIDALLAEALACESEAPPTLEGFLAWTARGDVTVKREMDRPDHDGPGAVRVMTVHGAKGLEAPVVIAPDCGPRKAADRRALARLPGDPPVTAWRGGPKPPALEAEAQRAAAREAAEARRLLYVAMTRAERRLVLCGAGAPEPAGAEPSWLSLAEAGLRAAGAERADTPAALRAAGAEAHGWRLGAHCGRAEVAPAPAPTAPPQAAAAPRPVPPPPAAPPRLAASALGGGGHGPAFAADPDPLETPAAAAVDPLTRGAAAHLLLERLPQTPEPARAALAERLLANAAPEADAAARAAMLAEAHAAMALPEAADFFASDALAEAALSVEVPGLGRVAGRVDRLRVTPGLVRAVDFKTDAAPPPRGGPAPEPYLRQLAVYRLALRRLHPDARVEMALLWTRATRLDVAADDDLDTALARAVAEAAAS